MASCCSDLSCASLVLAFSVSPTSMMGSPITGDRKLIANGLGLGPGRLQAMSALGQKRKTLHRAFHVRFSPNSGPNNTHFGMSA
jgi:hypothetical protein